MRKTRNLVSAIDHRQHDRIFTLAGYNREDFSVCLGCRICASVCTINRPRDRHEPPGSARPSLPRHARGKIGRPGEELHELLPLHGRMPLADTHTRGSEGRKGGARPRLPLRKSLQGLGPPAGQGLRALCLSHEYPFPREGGVPEAHDAMDGVYQHPPAPQGTQIKGPRAGRPEAEGIDGIRILPGLLPHRLGQKTRP